MQKQVDKVPYQVSAVTAIEITHETLLRKKIYFSVFVLQFFLMITVII